MRDSAALRGGSPGCRIPASAPPAWPKGAPLTDAGWWLARGFSSPQANENEVDKYIDESKTKAQDLMSSYWTRAMVYAQHCFMHALQNLPQQQMQQQQQAKVHAHES